MFWSTAFTINIGVLTYSLLLFLWGVFVGKKSMAGYIEKNNSNNSMSVNNNSYSVSGGNTLHSVTRINYEGQARVHMKDLSRGNNKTMICYPPVSRNYNTPRQLASNKRFLKSETHITLSLEEGPIVSPLT